MLLNKLKVTASALLLVGVTGLGIGGVLQATQVGADPDKAPAADPRSAQHAAKLPAQDKALPSDKEASNPLAATPPTQDRGTNVPLDPNLSAPRLLSKEEQLRQRYLELQKAMLEHLSTETLAQRVADLEKAVASAQKEKERLLREQRAAAELNEITNRLKKLVTQYSDTAAAARAQAALDIITHGVTFSEKRDYTGNPRRTLSDKK